MVTPNLVDEVQRHLTESPVVDLSPRALEETIGRSPDGVRIIFTTDELYILDPTLQGEPTRYKPRDLFTSNLPGLPEPAYPSIYMRLSTQIAGQLETDVALFSGVVQHLTPSEELRPLGVREPLVPFEVDVLGHMSGAISRAQGGAFADIDPDAITGRNLAARGTANVSNWSAEMAATFGMQVPFEDRHQRWLAPDATRSSDWSEIREESRVVASAARPTVFVAEPLDMIVVPESNTAQDTDPVDVLRDTRFRGVAERLDYLNAELADDPDWEINQVNPDSVASFTAFLLSAKPAALPMVGLHPSGFVFAQWRVVPQEHDVLWEGGDGSLIMVFEPSKLVSYAASSGIVEDGTNSIAANGVMPVQDVRSALGFFLSRVAEFEFDED